MIEKDQEKNKVEKRKFKKHIWSCGMVGFDISLYDFFIDFGLFFLTTIARVPAGVAGMFISVGAIFQGLFSPIMGYYSDRCTSKMGRRRKYMLVGVLASSIAIMLLFVPMPDNVTVKIAFYGAATLLFWVMYTVFYTPFLAFGGEVAHTYDERTLLRTIVTVANNAGNIILAVMTTSAVALFVSMGFSEHNSWFIATAIFCVSCIVFVLIGYKMTAGYDKVIQREDLEDKVSIFTQLKNILTEYVDMIKIKPLRILLLVILLSITAYTMKEMGFLFVMTFNAGLNAGQVAIIYVLITVLGTVVYPILTKFICDFFEKKGAYFICSAIFLIGSVYFLFHGINNFMDVMILQLTSMFILSGYWQIVPAMLYDIIEVDKYITGKEREGTLMSFQGFLEPISAAIGAGIAGLFLSFYGFDEALDVQTEAAEQGILYLNTILPAVFFFAATLILFMYPVSKKRHELLCEAIEKGVHASDELEEYEDLKKLL